MCQLLGGLEGINKLHKNADVMQDLAMYALRWNHAEGRVIAELIRRDAMKVRGAVMRFQFAYFLGFRFPRTPLYLQEAAAAYFLLRSRLIHLYLNGYVVLVQRLEAAV